MSIIEREKVEVREVPAELDEVGRLLLRAAEIVRERGWTQRGLQLPDGRVCALGALAIAKWGQIPRSKETGFFSSFKVRSHKAAKRLQASLGRPVDDWNDKSGRTAEEVAEALERSAYFG